METTKTFKRGDKVVNRYGRILTVLRQKGIQVFVEEEINQWYHPTKIRKITA